MIDRYEIEISRKVFDNITGRHVTVGPDSDGLGLIEIKSSDDFGNGYIRINKEMAEKFAEAILATSKES